MVDGSPGRTHRSWSVEGKPCSRLSLWYCGLREPFPLAWEGSRQGGASLSWAGLLDLTSALMQTARQSPGSAFVRSSQGHQSTGLSNRCRENEMQDQEAPEFKIFVLTEHFKMAHLFVEVSNFPLKEI